MRILAIAILALSRIGCVALLERNYYRRPAPKPCNVPVYVDGEFKVCLTREEARKFLKRIGGEDNI